jgi:phage/plasmid-like protein (TIGR03299 family)
MTYASDLDVAARAYRPAWEHEGIGAVLPHTIDDVDAARTATGLDWEPATEAQYRREQLGADAVGFSEVGAYKYVTRGEGGPVLDSANRSYRVFSNAELFDVAQAIGRAGVELGRPVRYVAGGEVNGGRRVYLMCDLGVTELPGDPSPHVRYLGLVSSHDGSAALKVIGCDQRWACTNMIHAAEVDARARGHAFSFRHTSRMQKRLADAHTAITAALYHLDIVETASRELLGVKVSARQREAFIERYALARTISKADAARAAQAAGSPKRSEALAFTAGHLRAILDSPTCRGIDGTGYGLLAATVEFLDHRRASTGPDGLFNRTVVNVERGKSLALTILRDLLRDQL